VERGRILRFDVVRGYGFIVPDSGGDDVFLHISALQGDTAAALPGAVIEFEAVTGDQGRKALVAKVLGGVHTPAPVSRTVTRAATSSTGDDADGELCEVVTSAEFGRDITDVLIAAVPTMTAAQIVQVRQRLSEYARARGWLDDH
jgi:cold shock CspA family protein